MLDDCVWTVDVSTAREHFSELLERVRAGEVSAVRLVRHRRLVGWLIAPSSRSDTSPGRPLTLWRPDSQRQE